jgi:ribosomal protein L40E
MPLRRICMACGTDYPPTDHACPRCDSHAGTVEVVPKADAKPKPAQPTRRRDGVSR